ncbi:hypothetical protein CL635_00415 [bacterium]|nr:hypothetical protein [bacterium]|tara:strand:- start:5340 stop:5573 length:234 start_codon:yes stop_codon:yes gene_type:complete
MSSTTASLRSSILEDSFLKAENPQTCTCEEMYLEYGRWSSRHRMRLARDDEGSNVFFFCTFDKKPAKRKLAFAGAAP